MMSHYEQQQERCFRNFTWEEEMQYKEKKKQDAENSTYSWLHTPTAYEGDSVKQPSHYKKFDIECIEVIACCMTKEEFKGYCLGNFLKYRFRMGDKGEMKEDFDKSNEYKLIYEEHSHLCRDMPF